MACGYAGHALPPASAQGFVFQHDRHRFQIMRGKQRRRQRDIAIQRGLQQQLVGRAVDAPTAYLTTGKSA
ncbi:hypothetical protein [Raoultella terrigena]|uniref:hypothetical protein n=1 Tax=Raoultella terrigena TaxID=577 RepID=UPI0005F7D827|nr:hypothetical protein [Raoultella terrigena]